MTKNFLPSGVQDLRRGSKWNVPRGEVAPAFKDSASLNLGYTTEHTIIPNVFAEIGGGALNIAEYAFNRKDHKAPTFPFGMDEADAKNFREGIRSAQTSAGRGFQEIYDNVLAIGHGKYGSVAPVRSRSGSANALIRLGKHASIDEVAPQVSERVHSAYAEIGTATWADMFVSNVPHEPLQLFQQIGEHARSAAATIAPELQLSASAYEHEAALPNVIRDAGKIGAASISNYHHISAMDSPNLSAAHMSPNAMSHAMLIGHGALPSIVPPSRRGKIEVAPEQMTPRNLGAGMQASGQHTAPELEAYQNTGARQLRSALDELLNRTARRPPTGTTAFDPRLTPAWAGLQLPA